MKSYINSGYHIDFHCTSTHKTQLKEIHDYDEARDGSGKIGFNSLKLYIVPFIVYDGTRTLVIYAPLWLSV